MPILNYTTTISTEKTAGEIQSMLAKAGANAIMIEYGPDAVMSAMSFRINTTHGVITFRLPSNTEGVFQSLCASKKVPRAKKTHEQAARVAWRILKDWIEAQLAITEAQLADLEQVFLPYAQDANGVTVYDRLQKQGFKALAAPN